MPSWIAEGTPKGGSRAGIGCGKYNPKEMEKNRPERTARESKMFEKSAFANPPEASLFQTLISFSAAGVCPAMAWPGSARQSRASCLVGLPLSCWGSSMKAREMLAGKLTLKCCAAQMASKSIENSCQGLQQRCFKPWPAMLHEMMKKI